MPIKLLSPHLIHLPIPKRGIPLQPRIPPPTRPLPKPQFKLASPHFVVLPVPEDGIPLHPRIPADFTTTKSSQLASMSSLSEASTTLKLRTRILEVERKFKPTPESIQLLRRNFGVPPFQLFWYRGSKKIHDIYFDIFDHHSRDKTHKPGTGILMSHGVYVRLRNWEWQAKLRVDGNFTQSQFVELRGEKAVGDAIAKTLRLADFRSEGEAKVPMTKLWSGTFTCGSINAIEECNDMEGYFGLDKSRVHPLQKVAEFTSVREEWDLDCFRVVIDKADFGWCVGEVELCESVKVVDGDEESVKKKGEQMDEEIRDFLGRYKWAFPRGEVEGKLSAWFRLKAEQV